jgi:hypothetical protein
MSIEKQEDKPKPRNKILKFSFVIMKGVIASKQLPDFM